MLESVLRSTRASKIAYTQYTPRYKFIHNKKYDVQIYVQGKSNQIIAFRGSHNINSLMRFMNFNMSEIHLQENSFNVHSGVLDMFRSIEPKLTKHLLVLERHKNREITFTGHSGGAALAMFASVYYASIIKKNLVIKCHMFGCPKVGDDKFVKYFLENTQESIDISNEHDIVQHIPLISTHYCYNPKKIILKDNTIDPLYSHDLDTYNTLLKDKYNLFKQTNA